MEYYFEFLIFILTVTIILYKPKELVSLHDTLLGKFIMILVVIILSLKSCLGGVLGAVMFMSLATHKDKIEAMCTSKNCMEAGIPLANGKGNMCDFMCTLQFKRYGSGKCKEKCGECCIENNPFLRMIEGDFEGFKGDSEVSDSENDDDDVDNAESDTEGDDEKNNLEFFNDKNSDGRQVTMDFIKNSDIIDDSEFGNLVKQHQSMGEGNDAEAKYHRYLNKQMKIHKFKDNYEMKKKLYHKNKSIESEIKELEENNKLQNERKKKLKSDMEAKNKEIVQAELMGQLKDKVAKATSPIPKEIQEKKLDDFLNSKFGKNNDLLSRVAALHGSNTRHDNGNIKTGLSMDIDEASGSVDSLIDNVTNMFSKGGMPLSQTPITDGGEDGLHSFLKTLN